LDGIAAAVASASTGALLQSHQVIPILIQKVITMSTYYLAREQIPLTKLWPSIMYDMRLS